MEFQEMNNRTKLAVKRSLSTVAAGVILVYSGTASPFGFDFGDSFNEGMDFDKGSDLDMGGSKMNWETPDNSFDTGSTGTGSGFSWGSGSRNSGPSWGFRKAPPPAYWDYPNPYTQQYAPRGYAPRYMPPPQYGWPRGPAVQKRAPAPAAPVAENPEQGSNK